MIAGMFDWSASSTRLFMGNAHDTLGRYFTISAKWDNFVAFCLSYCIPPPSEKGVYSKKKDFALSAIKFFSYRIDPYSEGDKTMTKLSLLKVY